MTQRLDKLQAALEAALGDKIKAFKRERGEITLTVSAANYLAVATSLFVRNVGRRQ
jgi:NADH-quinone oxidoreductase subunit C